MCEPMIKVCNKRQLRQENIGRFYIHDNRPEMEIRSAVTTNAYDSKQENLDRSYANFFSVCVSVCVMFISVNCHLCHLLVATTCSNKTSKTIHHMFSAVRMKKKGRR